MESFPAEIAYFLILLRSCFERVCDEFMCSVCYEIHQPKYSCLLHIRAIKWRNIQLPGKQVCSPTSFLCFSSLSRTRRLLAPKTCACSLYAVLHAARTSKHPLVKITKGERIIQSAPKQQITRERWCGGFDASRKM
jgi:hypothetical protein